MPTQECFLNKPIRDLYNADKSKNKEKFMQQLAFIYHYVDPRSSFNYILDDEQRKELIMEQEGIIDKNIEQKLEKAINCYREHVITSSYILLQRTRKAVDKVGKFLEDVDLTATDDKGKPLYTISSVTTAIKQIPQLVKDLQLAERTINKEIEEEGRARGGNQRKAIFEDGFSNFG